MRLYLFEHCSFCFRIRMTAALNRLHLQETVVLDDDSETMIGLVGKHVIPILLKNDGKPMLESMEVRYVDGLGVFSQDQSAPRSANGQNKCCPNYRR